MGMLSAARLRLYHLLFDQNRRSGRRFEGLCGLFALLSVLVIFIESGLGTQYHLTLDEWHIFVWLELLVTRLYPGIPAAYRYLAQSAPLYFQLLGAD